MHSNLAVLLIALPFGMAVINIFLPLVLRKILTFLCSLGLIAVLLGYFVRPDALAPFGRETAFFNAFGHFIFSVDSMGMLALFFIQLLSFIILIFSLKGLEKKAEKQFFILFPFTVAFCNGVILSDHALSFLVFWGLSGVVLYFFNLLGATNETPRSSLKTMLIVGGSDALLIMGFVLLFAIQPHSGWSISALKTPLSGLLPIAAFIFLAVAAFAKAGGFPMHTWVPDFSQDAPVESAALLPASLDKLLGIYLLARMMSQIFVAGLVVHLVIMSLGAITLITAVMMAMNQHNGRRLLGYHAVSQVGYMILGVGSGQALAFAGGLFHLINHTIYKSNLFLALGSVEKRTGSNELGELGGLGKKMPLTFIMAIIGALSISGIPPFNGFFSKWMIYQGVLEKAKDVSPGFQLWILACLVLAVFGSALTLASFMKFLHAIFLGKPLQKFAEIKEAPSNQWIATGLFSLLCLVFGVFAVQIPLKLFIYPAVAACGFSIPHMLGLYNPLFVLLLMGLAFIVGILVYLGTKKVRYDEVYLGGMSAAERFRVVGTEFYNEIRNMKPLKAIYDAAERKVFDVYDVCSKASVELAKIFQKAHAGQLQVYLLYLLLGVLVLIWAL